jgi:hypothetical protein
MARSAPTRRASGRASGVAARDRTVERAPVPAPTSTRRERLARAAPALAFAAVVAFYCALRTYQFHVADSDENIYFYMALRTAFGGVSPYRDYFFAHPPLHLAFGVVALKLGALVEGARTMLGSAAWGDDGAALVTVKSIGLVSGALGGVFVYRAVRRVAGPLEAWLAGTMFLLSPDLLHGFFTGVTEALMLAALGLERAVAGRDRHAGLAFAAACLVAMYAAPFGLAVWLVLLACAPRRALSLALWTAGPLLVVHGLFLLWAGRPYWESVFAYHLHKPKLGEGILGQELLLMLRKSTLLVAAVPVAIVALARGGWRSLRARLRDEPSVQLAAFSLAGLVATLLFVGATRAIFHYYFVMLMLGVAPLAGLVYGGLLRRIAGLARALRDHRGRPALPARGAPTLAGAAVGVLGLLASPLAGEAIARLPAVRRTEIPDTVVGHVSARAWRPSAALGPLDGAFRALLWRDEQRLGDVYPVWTQFLWDASQTFEMSETFARYVRDRLPPDATILGDSTFASTVALQAGHHLSLDEADTNAMRFRSGITPAAPFVARLRAAPPALIAFTAGEYLAMPGELQRWMDRDYESSLANDGRGVVYVVMRPRPPDSAPVDPRGAP